MIQFSSFLKNIQNFYAMKLNQILIYFWPLCKLHYWPFKFFSVKAKVAEDEESVSALIFACFVVSVNRTMEM